MDTTLTYNALMAEQDKRVAETISRERGRLGNFIRRRVPDASETEDILQPCRPFHIGRYSFPFLFQKAHNHVGARLCQFHTQLAA